jgi:hypothetical protein
MGRSPGRFSLYAKIAEGLIEHAILVLVESPALGRFRRRQLFVPISP